jgi:hypothetical protein
VVNKRLFDRRYGKRAFARLRSMLEDPGFAYQHIGNKFGLTRQYIAQLANELGINGRQRQRERTLRCGPHIVIKRVEYPAHIRAVINKIRRSGMRVTPYVFPVQPSAPHLARRSQTMVLVNGRLCTIQFRKGRKLRPNGREYVWFDTTVRVKRAEFAMWAMRSGRAIKEYVVPLTHLRKVPSVYLPIEGRYAVGSSKKPKKDWTRYEGAWHSLTAFGRGLKAELKRIRQV